MSVARVRGNVIIGRGMMAKAFATLPDSNALIFASGVSNSRETRLSEFNREMGYLIRCCSEYSEKELVYFSSYTARNGRSVYAAHKRKMETVILERASECLICRLPQVVGYSNNETLFNYLVRAVWRKQPIEVQRDAYRNLLDVVDVVRVVALLVKAEVGNRVISVGPAVPKPIIDIIRCIEHVLGVEANVSVVAGGDYQSAALGPLIDVIGDNDPIFKEEYQRDVIKRYAAEIVACECR